MAKVHAIKMSQGPSSHLGWGVLASTQKDPYPLQGDGLTEIVSHLTLPQTDISLRRRGEEMRLYRLKPSFARIVDYWLGGYHNFAIDRLTARHVAAILPEAPEIWREQRHFLQRAVTYMAGELGLNQFIDFGSGLPTRGNVHEIAQAANRAAKVIYSDIDPVCVAQAQEILDGNPAVRYVQCDVANPSELLRAPVISQMFGDDHRVGIGFSGLGHLLPDEGLARNFAALYEWAAEGSCMAVMVISREMEKFSGLKQVLVREGMPLFLRSEQEILRLLEPWQLTEHGIAPGPYWGLPEETARVKGGIAEISFSFLAHK